MEITEQDRVVIKDSYPGLKVFEAPKICGTFKFVAAYDEKERIYITNPDSALHKKFKIIQDAYKIEITFKKQEEQLCPSVEEVGGRLERVSQKHGIDLHDLHVNPDDSLCLAGPFDDYYSLSLVDFLDIPVLQFFYDQSYFEQYGRWPRGCYSHGFWGLLENFIDKIDEGGKGVEADFVKKISKIGQLESLRNYLTNNKIQGHHKCICRSGFNYRGCHPKVLRGFWFLQKSSHFLES